MQLGLVVDLPPLVVPQSFDDGLAVMAAIDGDVVFPTLLTQELEQFLQFRDSHYAVATEAVGPIVSDLALADVGAHPPRDHLR